jgi:hypothetical protein
MLHLGYQLETEMQLTFFAQQGALYDKVRVFIINLGTILFSIALVQQKRHSSLGVNTTQRISPLPPSVRSVTVPILRAQVNNLEAAVVTQAHELPSLSFHKPPTRAQISNFNDLSFALVPGANVIDYQPTTAWFPLPPVTICNPYHYPSSYSSLAGALDEQHAAETLSHGIPLASPSTTTQLSWTTITESNLPMLHVESQVLPVSTFSTLSGALTEA